LPALTSHYALPRRFPKQEISFAVIALTPPDIKWHASLVLPAYSRLYLPRYLPYAEHGHFGGTDFSVLAT
jgi:hypothetical protein